MSTMTLREALESLKGNQSIALDDGASNWYVDSLLEYSNDNDCEEMQTEMAQEVYVDDNGIYGIDDQGYIKSIAMYCILHGNWDKNGEFKTEEQLWDEFREEMEDICDDFDKYCNAFGGKNEETREEFESGGYEERLKDAFESWGREFCIRNGISEPKDW